MTEYWVSQAKYYCKFCKQWMADNKTTRQLHDLSEKHKNQVEYYHKKKRDEKLHGARSERELKQQMDMINRAAREAMESNRQENNGMFHINNPLQYQHYSSPPFLQAQLSQGPNNGMLSSQSAPPVSFSESTDKAISENLRQDNSGMYTVGDITYLEGQYHEELLKADTFCEIFVEAEDEWCKAKVIKSRVVGIAHTELEMRTFDISYVPASFDAWNELNAIEELEVRSDRIRLIQSSLPVPDKKIEESTGFGVWETVSVRLVDEVEEAKEAARKEEEEKKKREKVQAQKEDFESDALADNAMGSFDVYNTGIYKGIAISKSEASSRKIAEERESVAKGKDVEFKKRKFTKHDSKRRSIRKKTDDEEDA